MTQAIVDMLIAERDRVDRAILALRGEKRRGRPPKNPLAVVPIADGRRRHRTPEQRAHQSRMMRLAWKRKKAA